MKIGLVCPYNLFKGGGVQECVFALQAGLKQRGHKVLIISPQPRVLPKTLPKDVRLLGIAADVKSPFHTTAQVSVSVDPGAVDLLLDKEKFDLLHFHEPWVPLLAAQILRRAETKNVATFHAKLPESAVSKTIEKAITPYTKSILKYVDALTAVSPSAAEYIKELSAKPVKIIPNGIHLTSKVDTSKNKRSSLLYIGRLEKRKGIKYLLKAFAILQSNYPKAELVIVGDGPDKEKLQDQVQSLGLNNVIFMGYVSDAKKAQLLRRSDLFVSPALYGESFGIVLLEAMAAHLPIVAGNNPGYSGVLTGRGQLSLVNPKDTYDFARRMELFLTDESVRQTWLEWAQSSILQYDYEHVIDLYEQIYKQVIKS